MEERTKAKHRALYILERMDRTEQELREKLLRNYSEEITEETIAWVKSYGYIDDLRYARRYIRMKSGEKKSVRQIEQELTYKKGVNRDIVRQAFDEEETLPDQRELVRYWIQKKKIDPNTATREELQKLYAFLMRKGFSGDDIKSELFP